MKILKNLSSRLFDFGQTVYNWKYFNIFFLFCISLIFYFPVVVKNQLPLPLDALVGAHTPWIEIKWPGYEAGVPIKNQEITDAISQFYPWRSLVGEFWRNFKFPLWNQYMLSGVPLLATLHSAGLYPLNILYLLFNNITAWCILLFLQIFLSGVFMNLFLKDLEMGKISSLIGSLSYMFSGYMIAWLEFATGGHAAVWFPLLLLFLLKFAKSLNFRWVAFAIVIFFFVFSAGDFQIPLYIVMAFILFSTYLYLFINRSSKFVIGSVLIIIGGFAISSIQLVPTIELFINSQRVNDPYIREYFFGLMDWQKITNFFWPDFFGNVVTRNYWARFGFHEYLSYAGILPAVLFLYSLLTKKMKHEYFFVILGVIALLFLFPTLLGFLPYKLHIPALSTSSASRIIFLVDFCISVLASFGLEKIIRYGIGKFMKLIFLFLAGTSGILLGLIVSIYMMKSGNMEDMQMISNLGVSIRNMVPQTIIILAFLFLYLFQKVLKISRKMISISLGIALLLLTSIDLLRFAWKNTPFSEARFLFPDTKVLSYLKEDKDNFRIVGPGIPMNYFMEYGVKSANGYETLYPLSNAKWFSLVNFGNFNGTAGRYGEVSEICSPLLGFANVKYVVDYQKDPADFSISDKGEYSKCLRDGNYEISAKEGRVAAFHNPGYLPKVWKAEKVEYIDDESTLIEKLKDIHSGEKTIYISGQGGGGVFSPDDGFRVTDLKEGLNEIKFSMKSNSGGYIFISESYNTDWNLKMDGSKANLLKANYLYQALKIDAGEHSIELKYEPFSFKIGLYISIITALFVVFYIVYEKYVKKRTA